MLKVRRWRRDSAGMPWVRLGRIGSWEEQGDGHDQVAEALSASMAEWSHRAVWPLCALRSHWKLLSKSISIFRRPLRLPWGGGGVFRSGSRSLARSVQSYGQKWQALSRSREKEAALKMPRK
jgi:hypothetical protein